MIYDCFTFFNELDLLEIRLNILKDVVDKFVLVEARQTHTGKSKPLWYEINKDRFCAFKDRIVHVVVDAFPRDSDAWRNENIQRNEIAKGLVSARPDDVIMISDLDEIPNPKAVSRYAGTGDVYRFNMVSFGFYLNFIDLRCRNMCGTMMMPYSKFLSGFDDVSVLYDEILPEDVNKGTTATKIRRRRFPKENGGERLIRKAGWHFTCLGGAKAVLDKMRSVAPHHAFNPDDPGLTEEYVARLLSKGQGPALKMNCFAIPIDSSFPDYIVENQGKYAHLIFSVSKEYMRKVWLPRLYRTIQGRLIQFCEWVMPARLHYILHVLRMKLLMAINRR